VEKYGRARQATDDNIIRRMRFACWITKATDTHSEYIILIAFPWEQWLRERAFTLRYTYTGSLLYIKLNCHLHQPANSRCRDTLPRNFFNLIFVSLHRSLQSVYFSFQAVRLKSCTHFSPGTRVPMYFPFIFLDFNYPSNIW
jgi:hypothetical protein